MKNETLTNPTSGSLSNEDKNWAMFAHLCNFIAGVIPGANIIGPILIRQTRGKESSFVRCHANSVLNFQITFSLLCLILGLFMFFPILFKEMSSGFGAISALFDVLALFSVAIAGIVFSIIGAIRAREGREYEYPITIRFLK